MTEDGDIQLLQGCYDYVDAFKRVLDSTSKVELDYICLQFPGFFHFAKWMERLAEGIKKEYSLISSNITVLMVALDETCVKLPATRSIWDLKGH